jgi:hypothetical protein
MIRFQIDPTPDGVKVTDLSPGEPELMSPERALRLAGRIRDVAQADEVTRLRGQLAEAQVELAHARMQAVLRAHDNEDEVDDDILPEEFDDADDVVNEPTPTLDARVSELEERLNRIAAAPAGRTTPRPPLGITRF